MAHISCHLLPDYVEQLIFPPYQEAKNQLSYAFFQSKVGEEAQAVEGPSLIGRFVHLIEGLILMIPVVNWVVFVAMQYFNFTITGRFLYAVEAGDQENIAFYLNLGFDPDTVNAEGKPLIIVAAEAQRFEVVRLFLEHGANANAVFNKTPLIHTLIQEGNYELAKDAIRLHEADSALLDAEGRTILQRLYDKDYEEFLPFINEGIVHPNLMDARGDTILHHILNSVMGGECEDHSQVIAGLLALAERDVDLNIRSGSTNQTPLWMAYQKLGAEAAIAFMNYGANPNEMGDLNEAYPGASNFFTAAWERQWPTLLWATALKHGARMPEGFGDEHQVCNTVRQLDEEVLRELYNDQEVEKSRLTLLKTMDDAGWGTFAKAYQFQREWGESTWIDLLECGVKPTQGDGINVDAIMTQVLTNNPLQREEERRNKLLRFMQQAGWEMVRLAYQLNRNDDLFMLLRQGARPPASAVNQADLIKRVIASPYKQEIIPVMLENGWDFQAFCEEAVRKNDYDGIRFAIEMGMEVPNLNWQTARDTANFRTKVVLPGNADLIPARGLGGWGGWNFSTEDQFLTQLFTNIQQHNEGVLVAQQIVNSLEVMLFIHSQEGIRRLMRENSFEQFSQMLTEVVIKYPRINVDWFWADLLEIPPSHYANFATVQGGADALPVLPYHVSIDILLPFFDRINFDHPERPHYKDENSRKDQGVLYSSSSIRDGVASIVRRINQNLPDAAAPHDAIARQHYYDDHRRHLEAVAYYMQLRLDEKGNPIPDPDRPGEFLREDPHAAEPLHSIKANVLIDLGRTGKMCSGRWKDIMYQCRCRLSGEGEKNLSFVDRMRILWGNQRAVLMERLHYQETHTRDNVMYHLKDVRGIPGDKPVRLDHYGDYHSPHDRDRAIRAFDDQGYHARDVMGAVIEHMRQNNDEGRDFRELMLSWMGDNLAQVANIHCPMQQRTLDHMRRAAQIRGYGPQRLPYEAIEAFMREYDENYQVPRHNFLNIEAFFAQLNRDPLLAPFFRRVQLPQPDALKRALDEPLQEAEQRCDAFMRLCLPEAKRADFDRCIARKAQAKEAFAVVEGQFQERLQSSPQDQRNYKSLTEVDQRSTQEQTALDVIISRHAPATYAEKLKTRDEVDAQYRALIINARTALNKLKNPQEIITHFCPELDGATFQRLQQAAKDKQDAFEDTTKVDAKLKVTLQGDALARFNYLLVQEESYINTEDEDAELARMRQASSDYQHLRQALEAAEQAFNHFMQPFYDKTGARNPPRGNGGRFFLDVGTPLQQRVNQLKGGALGQEQMKQAFIDYADSIVIRQDQTLGAFLASFEFQALQRQLGADFLQQSGIISPELQGRNLSDVTVKKALAALFSDVVLSVSAQPFRRYFSDFQRDTFTPIMRPLKTVMVDGREQQRDVFERTRGFNPLVMYQMLTLLGELRFRDQAIFRGAFDALPAQVDVV